MLDVSIGYLGDRVVCYTWIMINHVAYRDALMDFNEVGLDINAVYRNRFSFKFGARIEKS